MKFISILLKEGRKEDLKKKYSKDFTEDELDFILNVSDLEDFNHKYTDFVLKNLKDFIFNEDRVELAVELVKDFDKYQKNLDKKDLNQYSGLIELESALKTSRAKEKEREEEGKVEKVYENDRFLVVRPLTPAASCKYGSNTKWCVTMKGTHHFENYTSGRQKLYFIIDKKNSTDKNYSKIAAHFATNGNLMYWNSQDDPLDVHKVELLEYAFPEMIEAIKSDFESHMSQGLQEFIKKIFNSQGRNSQGRNDYLGTNKSLWVAVEGFKTINDMGPGHAEGKLQIGLGNEIIDGYDIFLTYKTSKTVLDVEVGLQGEDAHKIDLELEGWGFHRMYGMNEDAHRIANYMRNDISRVVLHQIENKNVLSEKLGNANKYWRATRQGYKFKGPDKGLVKKLVDWLDEGFMGTKLNFLVNIGKLKSKIENGKTLYSHSNSNEYLPSQNWRGHFASFFASAKRAGILDYRKVGNQFFLKKGKNFDAFKEGRLKAF